MLVGVCATRYHKPDGPMPTSDGDVRGRYFVSESTRGERRRTGGAIPCDAFALPLQRQKRMGLKWSNATKNVLDRIRRPGSDCGFGFPFLVGGGSNYSHWDLELVGGLSKRLVLIHRNHAFRKSISRRYKTIQGTHRRADPQVLLTSNSRTQWRGCLLEGQIDSREDALAGIRCSMLVPFWNSFRAHF